MPEPTKFSSGQPGSTEPLFQEPAKEKNFPTAAVAIAAIVVVVVVAGLLVMGRHKAAPGSSAYAANLAVTNLQMSQSESLSGGKSTYLDGHIVNNGNQTVTAVTMQAQFAVDGGQPQTLTAPVAIIRTRQPYVDTEPVSAAPLAPGGQADFRLIFEGVSESWDQKAPVLQITDVSTR